ncbi:MAG: redoxin domain-containing protein [Planctomycetota bacterium]|nr:redoxin domain-containing protein [Planctomycetota bacterium]
MSSFYLGNECARCIEQLKVFAPAKKKFEKAGISIIAVSTDSIKDLEKTLEKVESNDSFPFPIVSDHSLKIFKAYRAFDDFENMPLHGTFLVDGKGYVRWQDISYDSFTNTDFLLAESERLQ